MNEELKNLLKKYKGYGLDDLPVGVGERIIHLSRGGFVRTRIAEWLEKNIKHRR